MTYTRSSRAWLLAAFAFSLFVVLSCIFAIRISKRFYVTSGVEGMLLPQSVVFSVPGLGADVAYHQIGEHPFVAEYSRDVQLNRSGHRGKLHPLLVNTGGENQINVYVLADNGSMRLRLDDVFGEYLWDVERDEFELIVRSHGRAFLAPLLIDAPNVSVGIGDNNPETLSVVVDGRPATRIPAETLAGRYIGQIRGYSDAVEFVPASIEGEKAIRKADYAE